MNMNIPRKSTETRVLATYFPDLFLFSEEKKNTLEIKKQREDR